MARLESMREIIGKMMGERAGTPLTELPEHISPEERARALAEAVCVDCGKEFTYRLYPTDQLAEYGIRGLTPPRCESCADAFDVQLAQEQETETKEQRSAILEDWIVNRSGIPKKFWRESFETFEKNLSLDAWAKAKQFAELIAKAHCEFQGALILASKGNGTGKTHLACSVAHYLMQQVIQEIEPYKYSGGCPVFFSTADKVFDRIRATYHREADETEDFILGEIGWVPLLILDDASDDKLTPSEHTRSRLFSIINIRYETEKPLIITTNFNITTEKAKMDNFFGKGTVSRLTEMSAGWRVTMEGKDYRQLQGKKERE